MKRRITFYHDSPIPYYVTRTDYTPGTPSNDDIPRDEMLLAEGLASATYRQCGAIARAISPIDCNTLYATDWSAAWNGASTVLLNRPIDEDEGNPDAYAAGAALAMALEEP